VRRAIVLFAAALAAMIALQPAPSRAGGAGSGSGTGSGSGSTGSGSGRTGSGSGADVEDADEDDPDVTVDLPAPATGLAALDRTRTTPVGFDHLVHDRNLVVGMHDSIPCAQCHPVRGKGELAGRPDHRACFGACHGPAPTRKRRVVEIDDRARVCAACHAPAALVRASKGPGKLTVAYPPYVIESDHGMQMSHAKHASAGAACTTCHPAAPKRLTAPPRRAPATVHARCKSCHDGKAASPAIADGCPTCHVAAYGTAGGPTQTKPELPLAFDHAGHGKKTDAACVACHAGVATADTIELPPPSMAGCGVGGCHDGGRAFSVVTACTKCHRERPTDWEVARPTQRFSHTRHADRLRSGPAATTDCAGCHRLGRTGEAVTVGHAACADAACHADDFAKKSDLVTCAACHVGTEPWLPLVEDQRPLPETEHGARIPHDRHSQACTTCHQLASSTRELRPPRGHAACSGTTCHAADTGPAPRLSACADCHQAGLVAARDTQREDARWSVRAAFEHASHASDPRDGTALTCVACHDAVATSSDPVNVPTPAKARCAPCHDGTTAFKLTGTGCARCHAKTP
jgi:c(7)-type cytochrome triheme protein